MAGGLTDLSRRLYYFGVAGTGSIPIIGLVGGIASGKSFYARLFREAGCVVIDADELVAEVYRDEQVLETMVRWWGEAVLAGDGKLNRRRVGEIVFQDPSQRQRLEGLVHPRVMALKDERMADAAAMVPGPRAVVWDIPLLLEIGAEKDCTAVVFVDTPVHVREHRAAGRGWNPAELARREAAQVALDQKRGRATFVLSGVADLEAGRRAVSEVLETVGAGGG